jgi:hypothetical protein
VAWLPCCAARCRYADRISLITGDLDGILGHGARGSTHATLEGLNRDFSAVKREARGVHSCGDLLILRSVTAGKLGRPVTHGKQPGAESKQSKLHGCSGSGVARADRLARGLASPGA